ncbi:MAG TPA: hypothetical protein VFO29_03995 [Candidatus Rubrimentiphilum sp.]|nr:hypothetical protein [Candidatus Rubrimentiphilum sp.]
MKTAFDILPLVIGVVGHRDTPADAEAPLRRRFGEVLDRLQSEHPATPLLVLTALAAGADIFAAEEAQAHGVAVMACLPMSPERFEEDFSPPQRARFHKVLAGCWDVTVLGTSENREHDYIAATTYIAYYCQILVALWDGKAGRGPGGTSDAVRLRTTGVSNVRTGAIVPYVPDIGPVFHIVTPREGQAAPDDVFGLHEIHPRRFSSDRRGERDFRAAIAHLDSFNRDIARELRPEGDRLTALMKQTDAVANRLQRDSVRFMRFVYTIGFIAGAAQIVELGPAGVAIKAGLLFIAFAFFAIARRNDYENRYQDCRALAEGLRVQKAWRCAGLRDRLVDASYLRMQQSELQWIRLALRTAYLIFGSEEPINESPRHPECLDWIRGQWRYYYSASRREAKRDRRYKRLTAIATALAIVISGAAGIALAATSGFQLGPFQWSGITIPWVTANNQLVTYLATVPMALAGLMALLMRSFSEHEAYSENTRRYQRMFVVFDFALRRLHKIYDRGYAGDAAAVIGELGHEALTEHADWLILHRERPLSFMHG